MAHWLFAVAILLCASASRAADPVRVCATTATAGALVREVGGEQVSLVVFAKGTEDAHFVEPRPSFIKKLAKADLLVLNGLDLELGWLPPLVNNARNGRVLPGSDGYVDLGSAIEPLDVPREYSRAMGDVHPYGNPHYLLDPLNGLAAAGLIRDRLIAASPEHAAHFDRRLASFTLRLRSALVGAALARKYGDQTPKLARLAEQGRLEEYLAGQGEAALLAGWLGRLGSSSRKAVADHDLWVYFARRFRLDMVGFLEPKPGVPPTTGHLRALIEEMRARDVRLILSAAYYDASHARFVSQHTGARIARMAHEVGAQPGTDTYLELVEHNVSQVEGGDAGS